MLDLLGRPTEAMDAFRIALPILEKLAKEHPESSDFASEVGSTLDSMALVDLGQKRFDQARSKLSDAMEWQKKALAVFADNALYLDKMSAHLTNLIAACRGLGRENEAVAAEAALLKLKSEDPRFRSLDSRLAEVLAGGPSRDNGERIALAQRAYDKALHAMAAKLWAEALASDPKIGEDREAQRRYNAACSAALAGSGRGTANPPPDEAAKAKLRSQARSWLAEERLAWAKFFESGNPQARQIIAQVLSHWKTDQDLAGVRDANALAKLPSAERTEWLSLWADVENLLKRVEARAR
jgi:hypothetical protein